MSEKDTPKLEDVMDYYDFLREDDKRWLVLFEEDYENVAIDPEGNVGVLIDIEQAGEIIRLGSKIMADLSWRDADADDPLRDMVAALEQVIEEGEYDDE